MNNKSYLLMTLLLSILAMPVYLQAKPTAFHAVTSSGKDAATRAHNNALSDSQSEQTSLPTVNQIRFAGNTAFSSEILKKAIPLKIGDIVNEHVIMDSMVKIAQIYKDKNIRVTITPVLEKASLKSKNVQFEIHEISINEKKN